MFDSLIEDYWRGYTYQQHAKALYETLLNYLIKNNIINEEDYRKYEKENFDDMLALVIEKDKKEREEEELWRKVI